MPPEERGIVEDWLVSRQPVPNVKISLSKESEFYFMKYLAYAPGNLVGRYANGDVVRTEKLYKLLHGSIKKRGMERAYDVERELMLILLESERHGVKVDKTRLGRDIDMYRKSLGKLDKWIISELKCADDINFNSGNELVQALIKAGRIDMKLLGVTPTGKPQTNKEALAGAVTDRTLLACLKYRTQLKTCLGTFMEPWYATASMPESGGRIFTNWNQVKGDLGTRTGRLSSTPNFQNIPKEFLGIFWSDVPGRPDLPVCPFTLPSLPKVRGYVIPRDKDHVLLDRDYSQQELRVLGHFEDGVLAGQYKADPWMDMHEYARVMINKMTGKNFDRKIIKTTGFALLYGMGVGLMAQRSEVPVEVAKEVKNAYLALFPGLKAITFDMRYRAQAKIPIKTWGGREYYCEEPAIVDGSVRTFDYKLINYLIQGSSADCTKQAVINYAKTKPEGHNLLALVHDEALVECPRKEIRQGMACLKVAMESVKFDVPMLTEGTWSYKNWSDLKPFDTKGEVKCRL